MSDETFHICERCRERVEPDAQDVVRAVELDPAPAFGDEGALIEGMGVFFHRGCFPANSSRYRLVPRDG